MSEQIFEQMRDEMCKKWGTVSVANYHFAKKTLLEQLKVMDALVELQIVEWEREDEREEAYLNKWRTFEEGFQKNSNDSVEDVEDYKAARKPVKLAKHSVKQVEKEEGQVYPFQRNLQGGILSAIKGFVPEGIVRKLGLEHGDLVRATLLSSVEGRSPRYLYELVEKMNKPALTNRVQFNHCPVEVQAGRLLVTKSGDDKSLMKVNGDLFHHMFTDYEVEEFELKEGDLVDIALFSDSLTSSRLIWKHKDVEIQVKENSVPEVAVITAMEKPEEMKEELLLEGKTILLVGDSLNRSAYEYEILNAGGILNLADGKQKTEILHKQVAKSYMVVCISGKCSKKGMSAAKDASLALGVPFVQCWSHSAKHVIKSIESQLEQQKIG